MQLFPGCDLPADAMGSHLLESNLDYYIDKLVECLQPDDCLP